MNDNRQGMSTGTKVLLGCGLGCGALALLSTIGIIALFAMMPENAAIPGPAMSTSDLKTLRDIGALKPDEEIIYFYTTGIFDVAEGGSFYTPERVVYYEQAGESAFVEEAPYDRIVAIEPIYSNSWIDNSLIAITRDDESEFILEVTSFDGADRKFFNRLMSEWKKNGGGETEEDGDETQQE